MDITREQALRYRWRAQQLDRAPGETTLAQVATLDLGVQGGAGESARLALVDRGVPVADAVAATTGPGDDLALVWSLRASPHYHRRRDLTDVATALSPYDAADAARRLAAPGASLRKAGVDVRRALAEVGGAQRELLEEPAVKGEVSGRLRGRLPTGYETDCRPCGVTHCFESLFRAAGLFAGIELEPGTSPPVLRRVPGWPADRAVGPAADPDAAPARLQPVRAYLHHLGPATPREVAAFLDSSVTAVKARWPRDAVEVELAGTTAWILRPDVEALEAAGREGPADVRLLAPFDLFTAARDRAVLAPTERHRELWPAIGRPGAIARDGRLLGTWRPTSAKDGLTLRLRPWDGLDPALRREIDRRAELLARARGQSFAGTVLD